MKSFSHAQCGLMLVELLIALAIAAMLAAPLGAMVLNALEAQSIGGDTNDVAQQAQFAIQRMETAVRCTAAAHALAPKALNTTANWLAPVADCLRAKTIWTDTSLVDVAYCLRPNTLRANTFFLMETASTDGTCDVPSASVIADNVSDFNVPPLTPVAGVSPVIEIDLTVTGATGQSILLKSRTRLGGGTL